MTYTAPDSEAIAQGFILPTGADLIRDGDNAIKHNAKVAAGLFRNTAQAIEVADRVADLEETALPGGLPQLLTDPTYSILGVGGWHFLGGTGTVSDGVATFTGNGSTSGIGLYSGVGNSFIAKAGHRYYVHTRMEIPTSSPYDSILLSVSLSDNTTHTYVGGMQTAVGSPVKGTVYTISGIVDLPADYAGKEVRLFQRAYFSAGQSNTAKVKLYPATILDLTEGYPGLPEPGLTTLDREVEALPGMAAPASGLVRPAASLIRDSFQPRRKHSVAAGPHVVLRFDDGYLNNLEVAAPILARYGYRGTLFTGTHPTEWLGSSHAGHALMTPAQLRDLHEVYGWEIGSHTRRHDDAISTPLAEWVSSVEASITDLISYGLPRPASFAYANGSRTPTTDRFVYGLFRKCGITGGAERAPWPYDRGTFFTGWSAIGGETEAIADRHIEKAKAYVRASFHQGRIPVIGIHGVTREQPTLGFFLRADKLARFCQWLWDEGYPVSTMADTPDHNLISDPGFEDNAVRTWADGSHPWGINTTTGWERTSAVPALGTYAMRLNAPAGVSQQQWLEQRLSVTPGTTYHVYLRHTTATLTAGGIRAAVYFHDLHGNAIGASVTALTIATAAPGGAWVGGSFTVPAGAHVARLNVQTDPTAGFSGDARIDYVAAFPSSTYNPLA